MNNTGKKLYDFGPFRLRSDDRTFWRDGILLELTTKEFEMLRALVEAPGQVLEKQVLLEKVWPGLHVDDNNLVQQVSSLRSKLGKQPNGEEYIQTVRGRGYRFLAEVTVSPDLRVSEALQADQEPADQSTAFKDLQRGVKKLIILGATGTIVAVLAILAINRVRTGAGHTKAVERPSLAVLRFKNRSRLAQSEWMSTALAEMFRAQLAATEMLHPISGEEVARMQRELALGDDDSFSKGTLARIRRNLGADYVLSGSYVDLAGDIRLNLTLQEARSGLTVAAFPEAGTESTLFQIVTHAATILASKFGLPEPRSNQRVAKNNLLPRNLAAQKAYAQGIAKLRVFDALGAKELLEKSVQAEPSYALGHAALADAWAALGYQANAKEEARFAAELSTGLAPDEALSITGRFHELSNEWQSAIETYQKLHDFSPENIDYGLRLANAQASAGRPRDALLTITRLRSLPDPARDDPRIDLAGAATAESLGDFRREEATAAKAEAKAQGRGAKLLVASAQLRQCWAHYKLGEPEKAIRKAEEARRIFVAMGDRGGEAKALKNLADVIDDQGDHAGGIKTYEKALAIFQEIGQQAGVTMTLNNLGYALKQQGDLERAKKRFNESLDVSRKIENRGIEASALVGLGGVLWRQGDLPGARACFTEAITIHRERGDKDRAATALNNLAILLQEEGRLSEARQKFEESLELARATGDKPGVARTLGNIGDLLLLQGDLSLAKQKYAQQIKLGREIPENKQIAYGLYGLGEVLLAQAHLNDAEANLQDALTLRAKMDEGGLVAETQVAMAELALEKGNPSSAEAAVRAAAAEFRKEKEIDDEAEALAILSRALIAQEKSVEAQAVMVQARERAAKSHNRALRFVVEIAAARTAAANKQTEEAARILHAVKSEAKRYGYMGYEFEARLVLAEVTGKTRDRTTSHDLAALEQQAKAAGFDLIARKAASARRGEHRVTALH